MKIKRKIKTCSSYSQLFKNPIFWMIFGGLALTVMLLKNLFSVNSIIILNDEFGYWGVASYLAGKDWTGLLMQTPYYSYGYSLALVPLFWLGLAPEVMYQVAIVLNAILAIGSFIISVKCIRKLFPAMNECISIVICFIVALYPNNTFQAQIAWSETLLYFLNWLIIWLMIQLISLRKNKYIFYIITATIYMYAVHQRTVGILACVFIFLFFWFFLENQKKRLIMTTIMFSVLLFVTHMWMKNYITSHIFVDKELVSINSYGGQVDKIKYILTSKDGFIHLIESVMGKIFYLGTASLLLVFNGIYFLSIKLFQWAKLIKKEKKIVWNAYEPLWMYCFFSFLLMFAINAVSMNYAKGRIDILIYGRYMELAIGPILLLGVIQFFFEEQGWKNNAIFCVLLGGISFFIDNTLVNMGTNNFNIYTASALNRFFYQNASIKYLSQFISVIVFIVVFLLLICKNLTGNMNIKFKKTLSVVGLLSVALIWVGFSYQTPIYNMHKQIDIQISEMTGLIANTESNKKVYYIEYEKDNINNDYIKYMQYYLPDKKIIPIEAEDMSEYLEEDTFYILNSRSKATQFVEKYLDQAFSVQNYNVYVHPDSPLRTQLKEQQSIWNSVIQEMSFVNSDHNQQEKVSSIQSGYFAYGPYISLKKGTYEVSFELESRPYKYDVGICEIASKEGEEVLQKKEIIASQFNEGKAIVNVYFTLKEDTDLLEFRVYNNGDSGLSVKDISYRVLNDKYNIGADTPSEVQILYNILRQDQSYSKVLCLEDETQRNALDYLEKKLEGFDVEMQAVSEVLKQEKAAYILCPSGNQDWTLLLKNYSILLNFESFKLLVPKYNELALQNRVLSNGNTISPSIFQMQTDEGFLVDRYSNIPKGEYTVFLNLKETFDMSEGNQLYVHVLDGGRLLQIIPQEIGTSLAVSLKTDRTLDDLIFKVYTETGRQVGFKVTTIEIIKNYQEYFWEYNLGSIIEKLGNIKGKVLFLEDGYAKNNFEISTYLDINNYQDRIDFFNCYWEFEDWELHAKEYQAVILPRRLELIWPLLSQGYSIVAHTEEYVLLYQNDIQINSKFSLKEEIMGAFFMDFPVEKNISIPKGIYEVSIDILKNNINDYTNNTGKILLYDNNLLLAEKEIGGDEDRVSIEVSELNGIKNLQIQILEREIGTLESQLYSIKKISDGYLVNLEEMQSNKNIERNELGYINTEGTEEGVIYGPYLTLEPDKYTIKFEYQSNKESLIKFDVMMDGETIMNQGDSRDAIEKSDGHFEMMLDIAGKDWLTDLEFRIHLPSEADFTLYSITVLPNKEIK